MGYINYDYIENYIRNLIPEKKHEFLEMRNYAKENHIPIIEEESEEFLKFLISIQKPKKVLELGTAMAYSAIVLTSSQSSVEFMKTIEIRDDMVELAKENIKKFSLEDRIEVVHGDAYEVLEKEFEKYDFIFIDAAKGQYQKYFNLAIKNLNEDGIIICDNVLFKGMIANQELVKKRKITIVKRLRKFLKDIENDENYISSVVPIGDGMLLVRRKF
ncbi:MAG: O-methyltransferase [Peptoniphilaceae bacterium]